MTYVFVAIATLLVLAVTVAAAMMWVAQSEYNRRRQRR